MNTTKLRRSVTDSSRVACPPRTSHISDSKASQDTLAMCSREPLFLVASGSAGHSRETARDNLEEGGDDVKSSCPLCSGLHTCYNGRYKEQRSREAEQISKADPSSDCRLQLAYMKLELLVIADQHAAVNTFPGLVHTARSVEQEVFIHKLLHNSLS